MFDITPLPPPERPHSSEAITDAPAPESPTTLAPPFPLHPGFWWAILWSVFLMLVTQVPGALVGVAVMVFVGLRDPVALDDMSSPAIRIGITVAVVVAHGPMILLSIAILRVVAGRDWYRHVALRLPSLTHVLLALAMLPAFMILGSAAHETLKFPSPDAPPIYPGLERPASVGAFWAGVVLALLVIGFGHLGCRIAGGRDWFRDWITPRPREVRWALSVALLLVFVGLVILGYHACYDLAAEAMPQKGDFTGMEDMVKAFTSMPLLAAVVVIGVFPGLSEELWCRAFLGRGLVGKYGVFWGVLTTSFFFGAIHGDPRQGTMALLMGVLLHFTYLMSRSLLIPILLHFLNNSLSIALARVPDVAQLESEKVSILWPILVSAAVLLVACLFAFWQCRARIEGFEWHPSHPGVECPPSESGAHVATPALALGSAIAVLTGVTLLLASFCFVALGRTWVVAG